MNATYLQTVNPMLIRAFTPTGGYEFFGGVLVLDTFDVSDIQVADKRLSYDEPEVDCSNRMFQITNWMLMDKDAPRSIACFPSRRWRNFRQGDEITGYPSQKEPLLYIGNPVRVIKSSEGIEVIGRGEFIIRSGVELGY